MGKLREKKDIVEKEFVSFPDVAADIINVLLYQGKRMVKAQDLLSGPTETVYQGVEKLRGQYEDLCKYEMSGGRVKAMYLIANQSRTDGKMLLRKAGYTGGVYREQYEGKLRDIFRLSKWCCIGEKPGGEAAGICVGCSGDRGFRKKCGSISIGWNFMYLRCGTCRRKPEGCSGVICGSLWIFLRAGTVIAHTGGLPIRKH